MLSSHLPLLAGTLDLVRWFLRRSKGSDVRSPQRPLLRHGTLAEGSVSHADISCYRRFILTTAGGSRQQVHRRRPRDGFRIRAQGSFGFAPYNDKLDLSACDVLHYVGSVDIR